MSYAVIKTGGKQYRVQEGQTLLVERLSDDVGATVQLAPLLVAGDGDPVFDAKGVQELTARMVPIYQRHFSAADIEGLLRFYRSPLGRKVITEMPATMAEGMQLGQDWGRQRAQAMLAELQKGGRIDAQGRCPASLATPGRPGLAAPAAAGSAAGH
jgi:hypothetical protein